MSDPLAGIAHAALARTEPAYLKHLPGGRFAARNGVAFHTSVLPGPGFNFAACLGRCPPLAAVLSLAKDFFADTAGWGVLVEGDAGHPVEAALRAAGWVVVEDEPAFVRPELAVTPTKLDGLVVRPLRTDADLTAFRSVTVDAYGAPPEMGELMMPSLAFARDPQMGWFLGEFDGRPVAAGGYHRAGDTAAVVCLAVRSEYRGRGIGAAVLRAALADAAGRGCRNAALRSGPASVPLYEREGFRFVCRHCTYAPPG